MSINKKRIISFIQKPEKVFVVLALFFGIAMIFTLPLFEAPDEPVHFYRAYQVGEGKLMSETVNNQTGGKVRPSTKDTANDGVMQTPERFIPFPSSALYSPIAYVPQAIGIDVGRVINSSIQGLVIFGRLFNLMAYIFFVLLAIKIAKKGKWVYAIAALFPVAIQQASSLSTDVMTTGLAFITIAFIHSLFYQTQNLERKQIVYLILLAIGLGLTKQTNLVILLPLAFLPNRIFSSFKKRLFIVALIVLAGIIAMGSWYAAIKLSGYNTDYPTLLNLQGVDPPAQLRYLLTHPLDFIVTLFRTFIFEGFKSPATGDFYIISMYGYFSSFTYKLPLSFIILGYTLLLIALINKDGVSDKKVDRRVTYVQTVTFFVSVVAVAVALYIVWAAVGAPQIAGIQGRYFIPLIPLLIPLFQTIGKYVRIDFDTPYLLGSLVVVISSINLTAMLLITHRWFY